MVQIHVSTTGEEKVKKAFARLLEKSENLYPVLDEIGAALVDSTVERFETGVDPDGDAWIVSLRAAAEGGKTLIDRGHLQDSITHVATEREVTVGTNVVYAAIHQFGGTIKAKNKPYLAFSYPGGFAKVKAVTLPARPFLGLSDDDEREVLDILADWIGEDAA